MTYPNLTELHDKLEKRRNTEVSKVSARIRALTWQLRDTQDAAAKAVVESLIGAEEARRDSFNSEFQEAQKALMLTAFSEAQVKGVLDALKTAARDADKQKEELEKIAANLALAGRFVRALTGLIDMFGPF